MYLQIISIGKTYADDFRFLGVRGCKIKGTFVFKL